MNMSNSTEERPWGSYEVLQDHATCKVKRICVKPGKRLSYQYHHNRSETWVFVSGNGNVVLNDEVQPVSPGCVIQISQMVKHRVHNTGTGDLEFIVVQLGSYFGEDDIVRVEDDFGRV